MKARQSETLKRVLLDPTARAKLRDFLSERNVTSDPADGTAVSVGTVAIEVKVDEKRKSFLPRVEVPLMD